MGERGDWLEYKESVRKLTERNIKREWLSRKELRSKGWHVDHKASILDCYRAGVPDTVAADIVNLRVIEASDNLRKGSKSSISIEELWEDFFARNNDLY